MERKEKRKSQFSNVIYVFRINIVSETNLFFRFASSDFFA